MYAGGLVGEQRRTGGRVLGFSYIFVVPLVSNKNVLLS